MRRVGARGQGPHGRTPTATREGWLEDRNPSRVEEAPRKYFSTTLVSAPISGPGCRCLLLGLTHVGDDVERHPVEVRDLDAEWLLDFAAEAEVRERQAGRAKLRAAAQWCVLHPATDESGFVTWSDTGLPGLCPRGGGSGWGGHAAGGGIHPGTVRRRARGVHLDRVAMLADALDLQHRLPRIWAAVETLAVAPWKARKIAQATHHLSQAAAASVDRQFADRIGSCGWRAIETAVAQAIATHDPHLLETREKQGRDAWNVRLFHRGVGTDGDDSWAGTSQLEVTGDTLDLTTFHDLVCEQAAQLKALGDTDTLEVRKAKAVGVIANRQAALDLTTLLDGQSPDRAGRMPSPPAAKTKLYLHMSLTDLLGLDSSGGSDGTGFGTVERFGPATIARIKDWAGRSRVTIQPVLDMTRTDAVDAHDPPAWMRELVILRDRHCVFPWCTRDARACDVDHITPYEENGPPGQTRPDALAALCRRHHRAKTFRRWRYHRTPAGNYQWTGPQGQTYLVTPTGTIPLPPN